MKCLYCGKQIKETAEQQEKQHEWHSKCIKDFFGTSAMPEIGITDNELTLLAEATVKSGFTIPGVQKKISLHLTQGDKARLTIVDYPAGYILKPRTEDFDNLPEAEDLCMRLAKATGIQTVLHGLIKMTKSNDYAYITKRIDRIITANEVKQYAMEDFCQLSGKLTQDKYRSSYERCAKTLKDYSGRYGFDISEMFMRIIFSFVVGNSDMHLKNFSLIENAPGSREFVLSKAYDMLPVNVIMPEDQDELALTLNGKKRNIRKKDFITFAESCSLPRKSAANIIKKIISMKPIYLEMCDESKLPAEMKKSMKLLISNRINIIQ